MLVPTNVKWFFRICLSRVLHTSVSRVNCGFNWWEVANEIVEDDVSSSEQAGWRQQTSKTWITEVKFQPTQWGRERDVKYVYK